MNQTLIKWRLREVMARYNIKAIDLATEMKVSANAISNLRQADTMPRIDGNTLNSLCMSLRKLGRTADITLQSLVEFTPDEEGMSK